jgi:hypothetical protein
MARQRGKKRKRNDRKITEQTEGLYDRVQEKEPLHEGTQRFTKEPDRADAD